MKNISVEKFHAVPWWEVKDEISSFLKACKESGNPELLYRQGMVRLLIFDIRKLWSVFFYLFLKDNENKNQTCR